MLKPICNSMLVFGKTRIGQICSFFYFISNVKSGLFLLLGFKRVLQLFFLKLVWYPVGEPQKVPFFNGLAIKEGKG